MPDGLNKEVLCQSTELNPLKQNTIGYSKSFIYILSCINSSQNVVTTWIEHETLLLLLVLLNAEKGENVFGILSNHFSRIFFTSVAL